MLLHSLFFVLGLIALVVGAEALVRGASRFATSVGISPLVVGLTVVAFGTSAPEMAVSVGSALKGSPDIALGNVVGSNIANVLLILGISALIVPLLVDRQIIRQEVPVMIGVSVLLIFFAADGRIGKIDAAILFGLAVAYTVFLVLQSRKAVQNQALPVEPEGRQSQWDRHWSVQLLLIAAGLGLLVLGADWLVDAAVVFAQAFGISDLVIGLTIVAVGTSMPEIATSIIAAIRGQRDIAVGNVVGSNIFNICAVLGLTGLIAPDGLAVSDAARHFDLWVMLAVAAACLPVMLSGRMIARWEGAVFLGYYAAYTAYLVLASQRHDSLPAFSDAMLGYVLPITAITMVVCLVRANNDPQGG